MAIIFKPKTRVKKLQYGGSVPVYADFTPSDATQQVYNPIGLLKKYGSKTKNIKESLDYILYRDK